MEPGQLQAEAQDVCHQLLGSPFRDCHVQVWVGVKVASGTGGVGRDRAREVPRGAPGPGTKLLWAVGQGTSSLPSILSLGNELAPIYDLQVPSEHSGVWS